MLRVHTAHGNKTPHQSKSSAKQRRSVDTLHGRDYACAAHALREASAKHAESAILRKLHHPNIIDVRQTHVWERQQILIIEEELLEGSDLLDAAKEAIKSHAFKMTESFAAQARASACSSAAADAARDRQQGCDARCAHMQLR